MTTLLAGPFGLVPYLVLVALFTWLLRKEAYLLWAALLLSVIPEIGLIVSLVTALAYLSDGKTWTGKPAPPS